MAKAKALNGKDLMLWIGGKVIALSTNCTLELSASELDGATKDDGLWGSTEIGNMAWTCTNDALDVADTERTLDQAYDALFDLFIAGAAVEVTIGIPTNATTGDLPETGWIAPTANGYKGKAIMTSLTRNNQVGSNGTISVTLKGQGALSKLA